MLRALLCAALVASACTGAASKPTPTRAAAPAHSPAHATRTSPAPTLPVSFDDMMGGGIPAATVFVVSGREVLAVALLNHFVRYRIPVGENAQLTVSSDGTRLYIADDTGGQLRLRWFDVGSGAERAASTFEVDPQRSGSLPRTGSARAAIAFGLGGQLLVMREQRLPWAYGVLIHAHDAWSLADLGAFHKKMGCAERLLASASRIAIVCLADDEVALSAPASAYLRPRRGDGPLAAALMTDDGTVVLGYPDGRLLRIRAGSAEVEPFAEIGAGAAGIVPDGLTFARADDRIVVVTGGERPVAHVLGAIAGEQRARHVLANAPGSGILAFGQFAYWVDAAGEGVYHVDLASGLIEKMATLPRGAVLGALATR